MPALAKCLSDFCPTQAGLRSASRIHSNKHTPSIFRFVRDHVQELPPASIVNRLAHSSASKPLNVQILSGDQSILVDQSARQLMVKSNTNANTHVTRAEFAINTWELAISEAETQLADAAKRVSALKRSLKVLKNLRDSGTPFPDPEKGFLGQKLDSGVDFGSKETYEAKPLCPDCAHADSCDAKGCTFIENGDSYCNCQNQFHCSVEAPAAETCKWTEDADGNWDTSCDNKYIIVEGTPTDNGMKFCTYCGRELSHE